MQATAVSTSGSHVKRSRVSAFDTLEDWFYKGVMRGRAVVLTAILLYCAAATTDQGAVKGPLVPQHILEASSSVPFRKMWCTAVRWIPRFARTALECVAAAGWRWLPAFPSRSSSTLT